MRSGYIRTAFFMGFFSLRKGADETIQTHLAHVPLTLGGYATTHDT
jgi:hypothetical protein